jgi:hypothetical protein
MAEDNQENLVQLDDGMETETEVEVTSTEEAGEQQPEQQPGQQSESDDNFDKAASSTQKRIDKLTKKMREAERQREEALRYAQAVQKEADDLKGRVNNLDQHYVNEYSDRVDTQLQAAEREMAQAMEIGDTAKVVESQRKITALSIENDRAQQAKIQQERYRQQQEAMQQQQIQQPMPQQAPRVPDQKAQSWAEQNEWFGSDEAMTYAAFGIHKRLVETEGFDPSSEEYYNELDKRIADEFPQKLGKNNVGSKRPAQAVASVDRSAGRPTGNRKVRLSSSQVAIAKKLGVPLEEYAKYVKE